MRANVSSSRTLISSVILLLIFSTLSGVFNVNDDFVDNEDIIDKDSFRSHFTSKNSNDWSASGSAANPVVAISVDTSSNNEMVVAGVISGSTTMSMGSASVTSGQYVEPWIAKADSNGNWQWIEKISVTGTSQYAEATITDIAVAPNGDIFATGMFYESISFGSINLVSTGYWDCWTAKISSSGQWQWADSLNGDGDYDGITVTTLDVVYGTSITTDSNSNPIIGGFFLGNTDVGVAADTGAQSGDDIEIFVAKYSNSGSFQWSEVARGQGIQEVNSMIVDSSNSIWISTTFEVSMNFGSVVANAGINEVPVGIAKISNSGNWQSAYATTGSGQATITDFDIDNQNNILMAGSHSGSVTFGTQLTSAGQTDALVASMSPTGTWNWANSIGGSSYESGSGVAFDSATGYTMIGLSSQSSFSFGGNNFVPRGLNDSLVLSFDSNGGPVSLFDAGSNADDAVSGISLMPNGALVVVGNYNGTIDFGSSSASTQSTSVMMPYVWFTETVAVLDADGDGVADEDDNCPNDANPGQENTDLDSEGDECDSDDDNDGITDNFPDNCPRNSQTGWTSTRDFSNPSASTDWDNDGCKDDHPEDLDDDNDGILDLADTCPLTSFNPPRPTWISEPTTDMDGDGCRDSDEDDNDDGDDFDDSADNCPTTYGTSTLGRVGCLDSDGDGWADTYDDCPVEYGNSSQNNKIGCLDSDGDGWANVDDAFEFEPTQWLDSDNDGYGDRQEGVNADSCVDDSGDSYADRKGCVDSDGDGYSDPDNSWDSGDGADAFKNDDSQWSDFDEDGFGDNWGNSSWTDRPENWPGIFVNGISETSQDACPLQPGNSTQDGIIGCPDYDGDGWYDVQDEFVFDASQWKDTDGDGFGDNQLGNQPDACITISGNSTEDRFGCVDTDGDGYSNPVQASWSLNDGADAFISEPSQWQDSDVDGYGDNQEGSQPDSCPSVKGTSTIDRFGCPDFDEDGYSNPTEAWTIAQGADACFNVNGNSTNDRVGCYDSDGDGYSNTDPDWSYSAGADGYPDDPTKWGEPPKSDSASSSTFIFVGGGAFILLAIVAGGLLIARRNRNEEQKMYHSQEPMMNQMYAQNNQQQPQQAQYQQQVSNNGPPVQQTSAPAAQPDPGLEYYHNLVAQGYPHEHAVAYTQQYYPQFNR